jgi:hypothetical protein
LAAVHHVYFSPRLVRHHELVGEPLPAPPRRYDVPVVGVVTPTVV